MKRKRVRVDNSRARICLSGELCRRPAIYWDRQAKVHVCDYHTSGRDVRPATDFDYAETAKSTNSAR